MVSVVLASMTAIDDHQINLAVEKSWLIGIVVALVVQVFGGVWWAASTSTQLASIEVRLVSVERQVSIGVQEQIVRADKMGRLEERNNDLSGAIKDINAHLAAIEAYLNTQARSKR